jgi:hypothetical protein
MKPYSIGLSIGPHLKFGRQWKAFVVMESIFGRQFVAIIWHFFLNAYQSEPFKCIQKVQFDLHFKEK